MTNSTVRALIAAVDATSLDEDKAEPILKTFLELDSNEIEQPKDVLDNFEKVVDAAGTKLDKATVEETLDWVSGLTSKVDLDDRDVLNVCLNKTNKLVVSVNRLN